MLSLEIESRFHFLTERLVDKCALPSEEASMRQEQAKTISGGFELMDM